MRFLNNIIDKRINKFVNEELENNYDISSSLIKDEMYTMMENYCWYYSNSSNELERFYKKYYPSGFFPVDNLFYRVVDGKSPRIHVPAAKLITDTVVNLCFNEIPELLVNTGNQKTSEILNREVKETLEENNQEYLLKKFATAISYSGAAAIKPIIDTEISDNVILQVYPKEDILVNRKYDRIIEIIFKDYYDNDYTLHSIYGKGYIRYELYKGNKLAKLTDIPATRDLHDWYFLDTEGNLSKEILAVYMENNDNAQSDYHGCIDLFQTLDETKSAMLDIGRNLKPKTYFPSGLCKIKGVGAKAEAILPNSWDREEILIESNNPDPNANSKILTDYTNPNIQSYQDLFENTFKDILKIVSLSESSIGGNDGGSNSSGLALNVREKATLRKRATLITRYNRAFAQLTKLILLYQHSDWTREYVMLNIPVSEYEYNVNFSEYSSPTVDEIARTIIPLYNAGLIDIKFAITELYGDKLSEEEIDSMIETIKNKSNIDKEQVKEENN